MCHINFILCILVFVTGNEYGSDGLLLCTEAYSMGGGRGTHYHFQGVTVDTKSALDSGVQMGYSDSQFSLYYQKAILLEP